MPDGAVKLTVARASPGTAVTLVGAPGTAGPTGDVWADGVTAQLQYDAGPVPRALGADTEKVYAAPFVKPVTTSGLAGPDVMAPPGEAVTVYNVIGEPPLFDGGSKLTVTLPFPATGVIPV